MSFDPLQPSIVLDMQVWASFERVLKWRQNEGLGMVNNITISKIGPKNKFLTSKKV